LKKSTYKLSERGTATFLWCWHRRIHPGLLIVLKLPLLTLLHVFDRHLLLLGLLFKFLLKISQLLLERVALSLGFGYHFLLLLLSFNFLLLSFG
jgi:hypothetical protein